MNKILFSVFVGIILGAVQGQGPRRTSQTQWQVDLTGGGQILHGGGGIDAGPGADMRPRNRNRVDHWTAGPSRNNNKVMTPPANPQADLGTTDLAQLILNAVVPDTSRGSNSSPNPSVRPVVDSGLTAIHGSGLRPGVDPSASTQALGQGHGNSVMDKGSPDLGGRQGILHRPKRQGPGRKERNGRRGRKNRGRNGRNRNRSQIPQKTVSMGGAGGQGGSVGADSAANAAMMMQLMQMFPGGADMGMLNSLMGAGPAMSTMGALSGAAGASTGNGQGAGRPNGNGGASGVSGGAGAAGMAAMMAMSGMGGPNLGIGFGPIPPPPPGYVNPLGVGMPYIPGLTRAEVVDMMGTSVGQLPRDLAEQMLFLRRTQSLDQVVDTIGDMWQDRQRLMRLQQMRNFARAGTHSSANGASSVVSMPKL